MNLANKLTMLRVVMIPAFVIVLYADFEGCRYVALALFAIASFTDFLDGYIARSRNLVTDFGKFMDPLADKVLVMTAMPVSYTHLDVYKRQSTHCVRVDFLEQVVLGEIRRLRKFASLYEDELLKAVTGHSQQAAEAEREGIESPACP